MGVAFVALLGLLDFHTGWELSFSIFYLIPIIPVAWFGGPAAGIVVSIASAGMFTAVDMMLHSLSHPALHAWNGIVRLGFFLIITFALVRRRAAERLKDEFVSTVSHELRTPLTSVVGALGVVAGGLAGEIPAKARDMIGKAYNNSERLMRLINDLLDIQKIESGRVAIHLRPIPLVPLVEESVEANRAYGGKYQVSFRLEKKVPDISVEADIDRLNQVLTNLLSNAAKFTTPGDEVVVAVERVDNHARVSITDHGPGIPESHRNRLFQKFVQLDPWDSRQKGGTGLGLSISKALVEGMGGAIGLHSIKGQGSTFYIDLEEARSKPSG